MGLEVEIKDSGATSLAKRLSDLGQELTIGLHEDTPAYPDGTPVATVGSANEFGTDTLPQRSWLRGWVDSGGENKVGDTGQAQIVEVVDGAAPDTVSVKVGEMSVKGITERIEGGIFPPLSPTTLANPARVGGDTPLMDTEHMVDNIAWEPSS